MSMSTTLIESEKSGKPARMVPWTIQQYDADRTRLRSSLLKSILKPQGPRAFWFASQAIQERDEDDSTEVNELVLGNLFHELALRNRVCWVTSDERRGTKKWKEVAEANPDKVVIRSRHEKEMLRWQAAVMRNKEARKIIESGYPELTVHLDHESGVQCKARFDLFCGQTGGIFDLKTTCKDDRQGFEWQSEGFLYHVSAGFYDLHREGLDIYSAPYKYICVTKGNPSYCWVFPISYTLMSAGRSMALEGLRRIAQCRRNEQEVIARGGDPMDCWPDWVEQNQGDEMVPRIGTASRIGLLTGEENGWNQ